ncbi:hypothetical protein [Arthrobacter sp. M4]|uniref:hypothetical protein n=1 Tax=Arthrobacter sp. M4 TaxID=218160 RepID=UPI001CDD8967|nr:hypothetical protein [Arthrobacter sp. M4]MCA4131851.1 hypothetical protein [Arthrobacter sp. M4]
MVALTVALVRIAKAPPKPATPPKPKPVMDPPRPALVSDDLAAQMRATKKVRHVRDMQEWDYEWIRLSNPGKSCRELNESPTPISRGDGR